MYTIQVLLILYPALARSAIAAIVVSSVLRDSSFSPPDRTQEEISVASKSVLGRALYFNSKYGNIDMINLLLNNGATISVEYIDGNIKIPVFIVIRDHIRDIESLLALKYSRNPKKRREQIQSNKKFKQKMIVLKEIEKILKNHYLNLLLDEWEEEYEIENLRLILLRMKHIIKEYGSVETFRDKFKLLIKNRKDSLKLSDEYNWNREIAKLVGEILQLSKNY